MVKVLWEIVGLIVLIYKIPGGIYSSGVENLTAKYQLLLSGCILYLLIPLTNDRISCGQ